MNLQQRPLPTEAGVDLKLSTALRIANNIAIDDAQLIEVVPEKWDAEELYGHLQRAWNFEWNEEREIWEQQ